MPCLLLAVLAAHAPTLVSFQGGPRSITGVGDVDADGTPDFALGQSSSGLQGQSDGPVLVCSGRDGSVLVRCAPPSGSIGFGRSLALWRDFDGDGLRDLAVSACAPFAPGARARERVEEFVYAISTRTGAVLLSRVSPDRNACFGYELASLGDLDADGLPDLAVGAPGIRAVHVLSGKDLSLLRSVRGQQDEIGFGAAVSNAGDVDGDARDDLLVGIDGTANLGRGAVLVSGNEGNLIFAFARRACGNEPRCGFGTSTASVGDLDGDGKAELLVGADHSELSGRAFLYSGKDGYLLEVLEGTEWAASRFGASVAAIGDVDGDLVGDFAVSDPDDDMGADGKEMQAFGSVHAFSGRTRRPLWIARGANTHTDLGYCIAPFDDLDGDGACDLLAKAYLTGVKFDTTGKVRWQCVVLSGKDGHVLLRTASSTGAAK